MQAAHTYEFGRFRLDSVSRLLWREGEIVPLTPKAIDLLLFLVESRGRLVTKDELMSAVWPNTFVEESNLTSYVSILRKTLQESPEGRDCIETIPKRGYRFVAAVQEGMPKLPIQPVGFSKALVLSAMLLVIIAAATLTVWNRSGSDRRFAIRSIAVLPFVNLSVDHENEYFSDGLTEELIDSLSKIEGLEVVARTSAFQFKNKAMDIRQIGAQLNAQGVIEGSVRKEGDHLRVTVQLSKVADGYHIWSRTFEGEAKSAFAVQQEIARSIASALRQNEPPSPPPPSQEAHDLYLQGRYHQNRSLRSELERAVALYEQAIAKDSGYAAAYAGLGHTYIGLGFSNQLAPADAFPKAAQATAKALSLDPSLADAHAVQGMVNLLSRWDWRGAESELRESIRLNPSSAIARHWYSHYLVAMGRFPESLAESKRAIQTDPLDLPITAHLGWHYLYTRQYAEAIPALLHSLDLDSRQFWSWDYLRRVYELTSRFDDAVDAIEHSAVPADQAAALRLALHATVPSGYWSMRLKQALDQPAGKYVPPLYISQLYLRLGETELAFRSLEQGFQVRDSSLIYLKQDPAFDKIRADPRFVALTRKVGLP
jgi:TolB-like protein/DNA-binding winged helix-turn-helix (wHTH) protein